MEKGERTKILKAMREDASKFRWQDWLEVLFPIVLACVTILLVPWNPMGVLLLVMAFGWSTAQFFLCLYHVLLKRMFAEVSQLMGATRMLIEVSKKEHENKNLP